MKNLKTITVAFLLLCGSFFIQGCKKSEVEPASQDESYVRGRIAAYGGLIFKAISSTDIPMRNVAITISNRRVEGRDDSFEMKKNTDINGLADFGRLSPGIYYYRAEKRGYPEAQVRTGYATVKTSQAKVIITFE